MGISEMSAAITATIKSSRTDAVSRHAGGMPAARSLSVRVEASATPPYLTTVPLQGVTRALQETTIVATLFLPDGWRVTYRAGDHPASLGIYRSLAAEIPRGVTNCRTFLLTADV